METIGIIGLGAMGSAMATRLQRGGCKVTGFDTDSNALERSAESGVNGVASIEELVRSLAPPRCLWAMVPHGEPTRETVDRLFALCDRDDLVVDGGNSDYLDSIEHGRRADEQGIEFVDAGVSGGIRGLEDGFNLMVGGSTRAFERLEPVLQILAPPLGYARVGGHGAGHFVKMVHNALEYVMLEGIGEAFQCLRGSDFEIDLAQVARLWQHGAVVRCWLLELLGEGFEKEGVDLEHVGDRIDDSGMGRWTARYAIEKGIPVPAMTQALFERFASQRDTHFSRQVVAALRNQFGGHAIERV